MKHTKIHWFCGLWSSDFLFFHTSNSISYITFLPFFLYLPSMGRLYSSQSKALAWGADMASPQVTEICFGIFWACIPFFWFWLPEKWKANIKVSTDGPFASLILSTRKEQMTALPEVLLLPLSELWWEPPVLWSRLWLYVILPCRSKKIKK